MTCPTVFAGCLALGLVVAGSEVAVFGVAFALGIGTAGHIVWDVSLAAMRSGSGVDIGVEKRRAVSTRGASAADFESATFCDVCLPTSA